MVKPGYKKTEIGVIPEDWEVVCWEDVLSGFTSGATPYRGNPEYYDGTIKWVASGELKYNTIFDTLEHISEEARAKTNLTIHPAGTFLMAITGLEAAGTRGSCALLGTEATTNQSCMAIYGTDKLDIKYLYHYYVSNGDKLAFQYCQGTKQQSYTAAIVKKLPILLPPFSEQQHISEALSDMDELIASLEKIITKKKSIKQGTMQELLTGKRRLPGFSEAWKTVCLSEIGHFIKGAGISRADANTGKLPAVRYGELYTKHDFYIKEYYSHISPQIAEKATPVSYGCILFAASGETKEEIGKCAAVIDHGTVYAGGDTLVFFPAEPIDPVFLGSLLNAPQVAAQKAQRGQGDAIVHIHADSLSEIVITIPNYEEQSAIAAFLLSADGEIDSLMNKLVKARQIKQGMMQQLLTGKIRLS